MAFNILGNNNASGRGAGPRGDRWPYRREQSERLANAVTNSNFGIELRTPFNEVTPPTTSINQCLFYGQPVQAPDVRRREFQQVWQPALSGSLTNASKQLNSSLNQSLKTLSDTINNVTKTLTGGLTARPKAGDSTNEE